MGRVVRSYVDHHSGRGGWERAQQTGEFVQDYRDSSPREAVSDGISKANASGVGVSDDYRTGREKGP